MKWKQLYVGKQLGVMGHECIMVDKYLDDYTVSFEYYKSLDGRYGMIRIYDLDGEDVVSLVKYPIKMADAKWNDLMALLKEQEDFDSAVEGYGPYWD